MGGAGIGTGEPRNPPGFGEEPFLAFNHAAVRVRLLPLLAKRLEMDRVELDGLDLRLRRNARGHGAIGRTSASGASRRAENAGSDDGRRGSGLRSSPAIADHRMGGVSYQGIVVEKFNLETGAFGGHGVTPVSISFDANRGVPGESRELERAIRLERRRYGQAAAAGRR